MSLRSREIYKLSNQYIKIYGFYKVKYMHTNFTEEELQFEKEVNNFFKEKYPKDIKEKQDKSIPLVKEDFVRWQKNTL